MPTLTRTKPVNTVKQLSDDLLERARLAFPQLKNLGLISTLREMGIDPLDAEKVRKYRRSKAYRRIKWTPVFTSAVAIEVFGLCLSGFVAYAYFILGRWSLLEIALGAAAIIAGVWILHDTPTTYKIAKWKSSGLGEYLASGQQIPEFALLRAVEVHERLPEAVLSVDRLTVLEETDTRERYSEKVRNFLDGFVDPFLVVTLNGQAAYIDVWDEADFERTV